MVLASSRSMDTVTAGIERLTDAQASGRLYAGIVTFGQ
jgi:hypothetical protein